MEDFHEYGGGCCPACCRAPDLGVHDYCLPCASNPTCTRSFPKSTAPQRAAGQTDPEPRIRIPVRFITAETEARLAAKKQKDDEEKEKRTVHDDKGESEKNPGHQEPERLPDDKKQHGHHRKHSKSHDKKHNKSGKNAGDKASSTASSK